MADKIRLGIIGANIHRGWAVRSHLPAVVASPEFELTGVCTTRMESAEESRRAFGARLAFDDYRSMIEHPEIDAVAVSLRVPNHYAPTVAAINAGKHIYTEWPLAAPLPKLGKWLTWHELKVSETSSVCRPGPIQQCYT